MEPTCHNCRDEICEFNENQFYRINSLIFCSLGCFYESEENTKAYKDQASQITYKNHANKANKRPNKVHKKKSKSKKRKK